MITSKFKKLYRRLKQQKLDGLLVTKSVNACYLSSLTRIDAWALITPDANYLLTDPRFGQICFEKAVNFKVKIERGLIYGSLKKLFNKLKLKRLGFEANSLSYAGYKRLKTELSPVKLTATSNLIENLRAVKDDSEIRSIKKAISITEEVFSSVTGLMTPEVTEKWIAGKIEFFLKDLGGEESSFPAIVASGQRTVLPHARPGDKKLQQNQPVLIDMGTSLNGYNSDLTRMVFLGRMTQRFEAIYNLVITAQDKAINRIAPGVKACEIDGTARRYLAKHGLAKYFIHSLGHGVGREVHEQPQISKSSKTELTKGMVITIEPGVYIPGWGGIRIEDMVLVTSQGHEVLSSLSKTIVKR
ncbi:MAG: aminopeptidase P family protein [Candidatus Omnitrophota bacterium]|nr:aminopeptidase P family protein [Candidatus Omnitrophota bacterium]